MTHLDVTSLAGDPGCIETFDEWAEGMLARFEKMSQRQVNQTIHEMTEEERDMLRDQIAKFESIWR